MRPYWPFDFSPYWPSNLRNCKIINVCYLKSIHLCIFFTAAMETHADFTGVWAVPSLAIYRLQQPETSRHVQTDGGPALVQACWLPAPSRSRRGSRLPTAFTDLPLSPLLPALPRRCLSLTALHCCCSGSSHTPRGSHLRPVLPETVPPLLSPTHSLGFEIWTQRHFFRRRGHFIYTYICAHTDTLLKRHRGGR